MSTDAELSYGVASPSHDTTIMRLSFILSSPGATETPNILDVVYTIIRDMHHGLLL